MPIKSSSIQFWNCLNDPKSRFSSIIVAGSVLRRTRTVSLIGNQKLSFFEIASKDHIFPKVPMSAKLHLVVAFYASTLTKKALDI
jgi:hypothetical protein